MEQKRQQPILEDKIASIYGFFNLMLVFTFRQKLPFFAICLFAAGAGVFAIRKFMRNRKEGISNQRFYIGLGFIALSVILGNFVW